LERDQVMCDLCGDDVPRDTIASINVESAPGDPTDVAVVVPQACHSCRSSQREMAEHKVNHTKRKAMGTKGVPLGMGVVP